MSGCQHCKGDVGAPRRGRPLSEIFSEEERARTPLDRLRAAPEEPNPALLMAWRLQQRALTRPWAVEELIALAPAIEEAEKAGHEALKGMESAVAVLRKAVPVPAAIVPEGF